MIGKNSLLNLCILTYNIIFETTMMHERCFTNNASKSEWVEEFKKIDNCISIYGTCWKLHFIAFFLLVNERKDPREKWRQWPNGVRCVTKLCLVFIPSLSLIFFVVKIHRILKDRFHFCKDSHHCYYKVLKITYQLFTCNIVKPVSCANCFFWSSEG